MPISTVNSIDKLCKDIVEGNNSSQKIDNYILIIGYINYSL